MIVPDINLLVYAYNADAPLHAGAKFWWEEVLTQAMPVGLPWAVACGFVRIMTDNRILERPLIPAQAIRHVRSWLERPAVQILDPGSRHLEILEDLLEQIRVGGRMMTDAHIAAVAIEHHAELHSNDRDFGRFAGLRWVDPLA